MTWCPPALSLIWGDYFQPDSDDDAKIVTLTAAALDGNLITQRLAVRKVARTFDIESIDGVLDDIEKERAAKQAQLAADMHAMAGVGADDGGEPNTVKGTAGKAKGAALPRKTKKPAGPAGE